MSESWERENLPLEKLLQLENYEIISNVKQREFKGGKPAILVNTQKFLVKRICPDASLYRVYVRVTQPRARARGYATRTGHRARG